MIFEGVLANRWRVGVVADDALKRGNAPAGKAYFAVLDTLSAETLDTLPLRQTAKAKVKNYT